MTWSHRPKPDLLGSLLLSKILTEVFAKCHLLATKPLMVDIILDEKKK